MRLAYIAPYTSIPSKLASSVHVMKMCEAYLKTGVVEPSLIVSKGKDKFIESQVFDHYNIDRKFDINRHLYSNNKIFRLFYFFLALPLFVKYRRFDMVHTRNLSVAYGCSVIFRIPTILELHDSPNSSKRSFSIFKDCIDSKYLMMIIVITKSLYYHIFSILPKVSPKLIVLPDGVSESSLEVSNNKNHERDALGIKFEFICVYTGHLYKGRGIDLIIKMAHASPAIGFYLLGGNDDLVESYRNKCFGMQNIFFLGFKSQEFVVKYQRLADVLLMPYENEVLVSGSRGNSTAPYASPLKMFEYMAAGRPIISSDLPVLYEILTHWKNALMIPVDQVDKWVEAIEYLRNNPEIGLKLGKQAKEDVKDYTWEKRAAKILKVYTNC